MLNPVLPGRIVRTERLMLLPVGWENLPDLVQLKGNEEAFSLMLHGVRTPERTREELEDDIDFWTVRGYGTWAVHLARAEAGFEDGAFLGICGLMERPDGRGVALRYALWPHTRGHGFAREAGRAALLFGARAGLARIIGVARESNTASCSVLADLGMRPAGEFENRGNRMLVFEWLAPVEGLSQTG